MPLDVEVGLGQAKNVFRCLQKVSSNDQTTQKLYVRSAPNTRVTHAEAHTLSQMALDRDRHDSESNNSA